MMTRDNALRLLALLLATLLVLPAIGDPEFGFVGLFMLWGLVTVLLCVLFVALWGTGRGRASGGDLK